jgi:2,3-dihydroxyphenylpropionate 1,2-dioxygenase
VITMTVCTSHAPGMGRDVARVQGTDFRHGLDQARQSVEQFEPDLVVLFAGDHRRAFAQVTPSFALVREGSLLADSDVESAQLNIPADRVDAVAHALIAADFDLAVCRGVGLDHGFGQPLKYLLARRPHVPVVPVAVNCASPPLPRAERVVELGTLIGQVVDETAAADERVLFIGTGGLSHQPPTLVGDQHGLSENERRRLREAGFEAASRLIKPEWDRRFLAAVAQHDVATLVDMTRSAGADAGVGAEEVRSWLAAIAAGGGRGLATLVYQAVPEWITGMAVALA